MLTQPVLVFQASQEQLRHCHQQAIQRQVTIVPYVQAMFTTGNDEDNRTVFAAEASDCMNWVGLGVRGPKKAIDKIVKGLLLHP